MTDALNTLQVMAQPATPSTVCPAVEAERLDKSVGIWMTNTMANALVSAARAHRRTMSDYIRLTLEGQLQRDGFLP